MKLQNKNKLKIIPAFLNPLAIISGHDFTKSYKPISHSAPKGLTVDIQRSIDITSSPFVYTLCLNTNAENTYEDNLMLTY